MTSTGQINGYTLRSVSVDSENNVVMGFDDMYGNYEIRVLEKFVAKTDTGVTVNVSQSGGVTGSGRTIDEWTTELMNSPSVRTVPFWLFAIMLPLLLCLMALGFGLAYGFRFFTPKKNG